MERRNTIPEVFGGQNLSDARWIRSERSGRGRSRVSHLSDWVVVVLPTELENAAGRPHGAEGVSLGQLWMCWM